MINTIPDNFIYFGLFLTNTSRETLIKVANEMAPKQMTKATKFYIDHITLLHKNDNRANLIKLRMYNLLNYIFENHIGETYEVKVTHIGFNSKAIAFKVELPDGFPTFLYKTYHITIATFGDNKLVESNTIINWHKLFNPITVITILKKVIRDEKV